MQRNVKNNLITKINNFINLEKYKAKTT